MLKNQLVAKLVWLWFVWLLVAFIAKLLFVIKMDGISQLGGFLSWSLLKKPAVMKGILIVLLGHILLGAIWIAAVVLMAIGLGAYLQCSAARRVNIAYAVWLWSLLWILSLNQWLFPHSLYAISFANTAKPWVLGGVIGLSVMGGVGLGFAVLSGYRRFGWRIFTPIIALLFIGFSHQLYSPTSVQPLLDRPNVILLGVDSLRPDVVDEAQMPALSHFLKTAVVFPQSFTPLSRTFPAWVSVLTGNYPVQTHARYSLPAFDGMIMKPSLATYFHEAGFQTIYTTDDRQFNNVDAPHFGFDQFIGSPIGVNDFLFATFNDAPLANLVTNTWFGRVFFPYNYANRAAFVTYQPQTYVDVLQRQLYVDKKPLFLAVHLCLPHWNWLWANSPIESGDDESLYRDTLPEVDHQFEAIMTVLQKKGLLSNAIVVVFSDHGQSFGRLDDVAVDAAGYQGSQFDAVKERIAPEPGHGTSIVNLTQFHNILAIRFNTIGQGYEDEIAALATLARNDRKSSHREELPPSPSHREEPFTATWRSQANPISLIDLAPTLLDLLAIPHGAMQGQSLLHYHPSPLFLETGFNLPELKASKKSVRKILSQGLSYFTMESNSPRVIIKPALGQLVIKDKQRAVLSWPWMLIYFPIALPEGSAQASHFVLVNVATRQWTDQLDDDFARSSPVVSLRHDLCQFYQNELIKACK